MLINILLHCVNPGSRRELDESALFWDITQLMLVTPYRRFGTTYLFHLQR